MNKKRIHIPEPCPVKWDSMTPTADGRYCSSCEKVVVDFTRMSDEEIKLYFTKHSIAATCGSFYKEQLTDQKTGKFERIVLNWHEKAEQNSTSKIPRVAAVFILGLLLSMMGCRHRRTGGAPAYANHTNVRCLDEPSPYESVDFGTTIKVLPVDSAKQPK